MSSREEMEEHIVNYFQGLVQTGKAQGTRFQDMCRQQDVNLTLKE